ncbi:MAG: hypothetical protein L6Q71_11090 [Planctomycetes bacterium]|nr:hypothetical protein [Planctomycetota bacterium]
MNKASLYREAFEEARRFQDDMARRLGNDFAATASMEWNRDHWWTWASDRAIQHITGERFWLELDAKSFASVTRENPQRMRMLQRLRDLQNQVNQNGLNSFEHKEASRAEWARILNRLLDGMNE